MTKNDYKNGATVVYPSISRIVVVLDGLPQFHDYKKNAVHALAETFQKKLKQSTLPPKEAVHACMREVLSEEVSSEDIEDICEPLVIAIRKPGRTLTQRASGRQSL